MEEDTPGPEGPRSIPVLSTGDIEQTVEIIQRLYSAQTSGQPSLADELQRALQGIQSSPQAWGLISGLSTHEDPNLRFFSAHTAQVKISRDWESLPRALQPALLQLLLETLTHAISPARPYSYQPGNSAVVRKIFGSLSSLLLRLPFHLFPSPLLTVLSAISDTATTSSLPPSLPGSGFSTPTTTPGAIGRRMRSYGLEWLGICVEEISRAGISDYKRNALRKHLETDMPIVMETIRGSMNPNSGSDLIPQDNVQEASAACKCAEAWIDYGLGADQLTALLPCLYNLLPLPAASSALVEALSESVFRYGKGTKVLTEPLLEWFIGPGQAYLDNSPDPEELFGLAKLLSALIEHSTEWLVTRIREDHVQRLLSLLLRLTGWDGIAGVEENVSEVTLPIYPLIQEAIMESDVFQAPHEESPYWQVAKQFFTQLVNVTRRKVLWRSMDKEDRETFESWRRDAGEVIVCAYYIRRDEMLGALVQEAIAAVVGPWEELEAILHCIRYSAEGVPLGEDKILPILFGQLVGRIPNEPRLQRTVIATIREFLKCLLRLQLNKPESYEEWFKFHPDYLLPVLSYLVSTLVSARPSSSLSRVSADALSALCDICRTKLVQHIDSFSQLHSKIGDLGGDEQIKVIQGITSVIQALTPRAAVGPVESIISPILDRLAAASDHPSIVKNSAALTACFKGLAPSDDDMFDLESEKSQAEKDRAVLEVQGDMASLRERIETTIAQVVERWDGDAISSLIKHSVMSSSPTLVSLSPLPLLRLVTSAAERSPSGIWFSLASTLVLRLNSPPSPLTMKKDRTAEEEESHRRQEMEQWNVVGDTGSRLVVIAGALISSRESMRDHPDMVETWFKFCSAISTRFPGVLMRLPRDLLQIYVGIGVVGLSAQERFSLKATCDFFISLMASTKYPSPLEESTISLLQHFGSQMLRAILLSAGSEGPRSVIPNLAELLAAFVQRVPGIDVGTWMSEILAEDGFPDPRATDDAKERLKDIVTRSRTTKKMREALNDFALVSRGLANTTYGNATIM
ncbi:armadillo-type protein [Kockovaella imperatae]|uniref:Armadillo-type protein n=1 Tax=Kockovaella imperatae TaxID=4999 RepID=A0A1Y1UTA6_9TREE|nr:armadillo-type protein [Kockovaella imperatae]ORX41250.1 armadillo-type protein [Kockovaella imperatae]